MNFRFAGFFSAAALLLAGCAAQEAPVSPAAADNGRICLNVRNINGFSPLSDRELAVTANVDEHYLLTVIGICEGLRSAERVGVADATSRICNDGFGRIVFRDPVYGKQSCRVQQIEQVGSIGEARQLARARREARQQ